MIRKGGPVDIIGTRRTGVIERMFWSWKYRTVVVVVKYDFTGELDIYRLRYIIGRDT